MNTKNYSSSGIPVHNNEKTMQARIIVTRGAGFITSLKIRPGQDRRYAVEASKTRA